MKIEKVKSKLKKVFNRVMSVLLPVTTLFVSCGTNALVVHAATAETETGYIEMVAFETWKDGNVTEEYWYDVKIPIDSSYEVVGKLIEYDSNPSYKRFKLIPVKNGKIDYNVRTNWAVDVKRLSSRSGEQNYSYTGDKVGFYTSNMPYKGCGSETGRVIDATSFTMISGQLKIFTEEEFNKYLSNGGGEYDIIKPDELEKGWYLKNVSYKVTADDSPSSEAGADATYIHFSWDTDNLQEGDLLEIKTKSYYKKILGEQLSGFHDFITKSDGVSAYEGKYSFSQYEATKAWFNSLENKPLVFKEYDTTDYYLRPYRQGQYGGWVHIKMGRSTPTSSPYIEDIEYGDFDDDNNWTVDEDLTDKNGGHHGVDQGGGYIPPDQSDNPFTGTNIAGIFSYFYDFMKQIPAMLGDLPALVGNIISFLPKPIIAFIGIGVIVAIILRIVGR